MGKATHNDAAVRFLTVNKETVWKIIKGMKYSTDSELAMAVHLAFSLHRAGYGGTTNESKL